MVKVTIKHNIDNLPDELRELDQWVGWNSTKFPLNVRIGNKAEVDNHNTWSPFEVVRKAVLSGKCKGAGFVFTESDPYTGIDLDSVIDPESGEIESWAQDVIDRLDSYTEISQSGHGIHIIVRGKKPGDRCRAGNIEIYDQGRYFALTGNLWDGAHSTTNDRQEQLDTLYTGTFGGDDKGARGQGGKDPPTEDVVLDPQAQPPEAKFVELLQDEAVRIVYERRGDLPSDSEYDLALAGYAKTAGWSRQEQADLIISSRREYGDEKGQKKALRPDYIARTLARATPSARRSDTGNAILLADMYGDRLRYDHKRKRWLKWGLHRWEADSDGYVSRLAIKVAKARQKQALAISEETERKKEFAWGVVSEHRKQVDNCLSMVGRMKPVADDGSNWDRDIMLLGAPNGVLDLRTGEIRDGKPEDRITMSVGAEFDPSAECPIWLKFLDRVTNGDTELQGYLQRAVGYSLTGNTKSQVLFFLYGAGNNGKSTFVVTIRKLLADYGCRAGMDLFMIRDRSGGHKEGLANLGSKRFVSASEVEEGKRLAVSLIKDMTGGETLTADRKYEHEVEYQPQFKIWIAGNHKPTISDTTTSIWRRVKLVPFTVTIPDSEIDPDLPAKLEEELSGVLNWAIAGCLNWQDGGLGEPKTVTESTTEYRHEQDTFTRFIGDQCVEGAEETVKGGQVYAAYVEWARSEGMGRFEVLAPMPFGAKMAERYRRKRTPEGKIYVGVRLRRPIISLNMTEDE